MARQRFPSDYFKANEMFSGHMLLFFGPVRATALATE
jgi:hypothetical protein